MKWAPWGWGGGLFQGSDQGEMRGQSRQQCNISILWGQERVLLPLFMCPSSSQWLDFPGGSVDKVSACKCRRCRRREFHPWVRKIPGEGNGYSPQYSCLENPMDGVAWWATVQGVAKSQRRLSTHTQVGNQQSFMVASFLVPCKVSGETRKQNRMDADLRKLAISSRESRVPDTMEEG